jgi:hypothetical protein
MFMARDTTGGDGGAAGRRDVVRMAVVMSSKRGTRNQGLGRGFDDFGRQMTTDSVGG